MSQNSELRSVIETIAVVVGSFVAAVLIIVLLTKDYSSAKTEAPSEMASNNTEPVAEVAMDDQSSQSNADSGTIDGAAIVQANCAMCHAGGLMGAPKIGDAGQWGPRITQGKDTLIKHAINGIRQMPARGGNASLSDEQVAAAVVNMANASGASF
jgi:cytochrome c5